MRTPLSKHRPALLWYAATFAFGLVLLSGSPADAEPPSDISELSAGEKKQVQNHVETGRDAYDNGNFEKSLREFQQAFELLHHPDFMYRIALAHDRLGHLEEAVESYRRFLEMAPKADDRAKIERTIEELESRLERTQPTIEIATQPSGADVFVGEERRPRGVTDLELEVEPGAHNIAILKDGFVPIERTVEIERGQTVTLELELEPRAGDEQEDEKGGEPTTSDEPTDVEQESGSVPAGPVALFITGGVGAVVATYSFLRYDHFIQSKPQAESDEELQRFIQKAVNWQTAGWTATSVTAVSTAVGLIWLQLHPGNEAAARSGGGLEIRPTAGWRRVGIDIRF